MRAILYVAAILFIITGAAMAAAPFLWPMSVALGISIGQGLGVMLGGFVLLGQAAILSALGKLAVTDTPRDAQVQPLPDASVAAQAAAPVEEETPENVPRVVAERMIEGYRTRILSDGSIEAELEQGWLRFDNEQHLYGYLRSLDTLRRQGLV